MSNGSEESSWRMPQPSIGDAVLFASDVNSMNRATLGLIVSPPGDSAGGAFLAFSQKALQAIETSTYPRYLSFLTIERNNLPLLLVSSSTSLKSRNSFKQLQILRRLCKIS